MPSKQIIDLQPSTQIKVNQFKTKCFQEGIDILIYCTLRNFAEQEVLYAQGRTTPGKIVTNARGGQSYHNFGLAVDFVPMVAGKPQWDNMYLYRKCGIIAESCGLEWAGRWVGKLKETAHVQETKGSYQELLKQYPNGWSV